MASNIGTWMHDVGGVWLMTSLTPSPLMVALMQTATSLPFFLLALPAGALADVIDRRRFLLTMQGWMMAVAAVLGALTLAGITTPWSLLALTFALGLGAAMNAPAWQAITPELVPREEVPSAVALSGVGLNLARAVGPALGGLIVAATGPSAVFLLNALSCVGVIARTGIPIALLAAGAGLLLGLLAATRYRLAEGATLDLTPSLHWPQLAVIVEPPAEQGPVLVTVEYRIDPVHAGDFAQAMREVRLERLRDSAMRWELFHDPADPQRYVETFLAESWVEHLRQHERVTLADREAEARARTLHRGPAPVAVSHLVAVRRTAGKTG